jgi:mannose/fructose/N-acetylgalactosamine-specific phosphotransferase system component IIB
LTKLGTHFSRVFTRMLHGKIFTQWPWPLTLKINRVPDSPKY